MMSRILLLIALIGFNAFFAASEIALISLNDNKIKQMADNNDKKAKLLVKLHKDPSRFLATIQIGITLAGFLASAFAAESFAQPILDLLIRSGVSLSDELLKPLIIVVITLVLSYFTLVFGELVPKRVAMSKAEPIAFFVTTPLTLLSKVTRPIVRFLSFSTNLFVRLFGIDPDSKDDDVTEEEIRMMIDYGEEKGAIEAHEKIMINNVFEFNNKTAEEVMTHRVEIVGVSHTIDFASLISLVQKEQYSRYPVYKDTLDHIVGVLHIKDLFHLINSSKNLFNIEDYLRQPIYVPISKPIDNIFFALKNSKSHMAIVLDDYGGTAGIMTMEDIIEEIVGNIFDEHDDATAELKRIDDFTYEISGMIRLDELVKELDLDLPVEQFDTVNAFLLSLYNHFPSKNKESVVTYRNYTFTTLEVTNKRIIKVKLHINQ